MIQENELRVSHSSPFPAENEIPKSERGSPACFAAARSMFQHLLDWDHSRHASVLLWAQQLLAFLTLKEAPFLFNGESHIRS